MPYSAHHHLFATVAMFACMSAPPRALCNDVFPAERDEQPQLIVDVSEELLNRFVATTETRVEPVRDHVLGAEVSGWQQTTTHSALDVRPAEDWLAAELVLRGTTFSDTVGITPQATAYTTGRHQFEARKEIIFPGDFLYTRRPRISVMPSIQNRAIDPLGGGIPLIGPLITGIAFQQAEARRPLAESIAAGKIANPLREGFNREVDAQLSTANRAWRDEWSAWLSNASVRPDIEQFRSSETVLAYRGRFAGGGNVTLMPAVAAGEISRLAVHESFINEIVARSGLSGQQFVPDDAMIVLESVLRRLEEHAVPSPPDELRFVRPTGPFGQIPVELFGPVPVEVAFHESQIRITLRVRLQLVPGRWSPPLLMEFAYSVEMFDDYLRATPEARVVKPLDTGTGVEVLLFQPIIRRQMQELLPVVHIPRTLEAGPVRATATRTSRKSVRLHVDQLMIADGWLVLCVK